MKPFEHTITTDRAFDDAVEAVEQAAVSHGFGVLHTHDVAATLAAKGFAREPLKIVEVCNARYASEVLEKDIRIALMLPCPITVYVRDNRTHVSTMLPSVLATMYPEAGIEEQAMAVQEAVLRIVEAAG